MSRPHARRRSVGRGGGSPGRCPPLWPPPGLTCSSPSGTAAGAATEVGVAFVVDFGGSGPPVVGCVKVPASDNGYQALQAFTAQAHLAPPTFNSADLLCSIDGDPAGAPGVCGQSVPGGYQYWSYWFMTNGSGAWTYANRGASAPVGSAAGGQDVEGWRFQNPGPDNAVRTTAPCRARLRSHLCLGAGLPDHDVDHERPATAPARGNDRPDDGTDHDTDDDRPDRDTGNDRPHDGADDGADDHRPRPDHHAPRVDHRVPRRHRTPTRPAAARVPLIVGGVLVVLLAGGAMVGWRRRSGRRDPRPDTPAPPAAGLHPAAWWLWAGCLAGAASRTTNPHPLGPGGVGGGLRRVGPSDVSTRGPGRSVVFFRLGLVVIVLRVVIQIVFGDRLGGHVLFTLPEVPLPAWAAGVSIGGPVTAESVLQAAVDGLRLAVVLVCFGAANSLASPYRLLRCLPAVLYEAGVAVTVSLAFAPEVVMAIAAVRDARRLRGRPTRGIAGLRGMAIPVLGERPRPLPAAGRVDGRPGLRASGRGRLRAAAHGWPRCHRCRAAGGGGRASTASSTPGSLPAGGVPFLAVGAVLVGCGLAVSGRRTDRTRYRPDPWRCSGVDGGRLGCGVLAGLVVASMLGVPRAPAAALPPAVPPASRSCPPSGSWSALVPAVARRLPAARSAPGPVGPGRRRPSRRRPAGLR